MWLVLHVFVLEVKVKQGHSKCSVTSEGNVSCGCPEQIELHFKSSKCFCLLVKATTFVYEQLVDLFHTQSRYKQWKTSILSSISPFSLMNVFPFIF